MISKKINMDIQELKYIKKCQEGELESFAYIYDKYINKIYKYIYYRMPDKYISEDLTSQTFIKALKSISLYNKDKGSFSSWLYKIAKNNLADYYRTYKNNLDINDLWYLEDDTNIEVAADKDFKLDKVKKYLIKLNKEQKEIVILRVWDELSYSEISEIVQKSEASCKMMFSRSLEKLKQEMPIGLYLLLVLNI